MAAPYLTVRSAWALLASILVALLVFAGAFALVRWWDFTLPSPGAARYQAVFLANGQTFFGRYYDRLGPYVKIVEPYYIQQTSLPDDATQVETQIVRRGGELHGPLPEMLVPKTTILFVEDLTPSSPITQFMDGAAR